MTFEIKFRMKLHVKCVRHVSQFLHDGSVKVRVVTLGLGRMFLCGSATEPESTN